MNPVLGTNDYRLVVLSLCIAIATCYIALDLAGRITANKGGSRLAWLIGGAFSMGSGIWCMHFTEMLSFQLPFRVFYHVPTVALSFLLSVGTSFLVLYIVCHEPMKTTHLALGSLSMGMGIALIHYSGMAALRVAATPHYRIDILLVSTILAIAVSFLGILLIFLSKEENKSWRLKIYVSILLGVAIPVMHYTSLWAITYVPISSPIDLQGTVDISSLSSGIILLCTVLILGFSFLIALVDRRMTEQSLVLCNERNILRALIDNIPDLVFVKDLQGHFIIVNPVVAENAGVSKTEDLIGKTDFDFFPYEIAQHYRDDEQEIIRTQKPLFNREEIIVDTKGTRHHLLTTKVPLFDGRGHITGIAGVGRNISSRKRVEDALREAVRKYHGIFDESIVGIFQTAPNGRLINANPAMAQILGYESPDELILKVRNISAIFGEPKQYRDFLAAMGEFGHVLNFEYEALHADGRHIWISMSVRAIYSREQIVRYDGSSQDITERKLLQNQLLQAQKLESVGQLAAGIAHEINTPTQYIGNNICFLKESFADLLRLIAGYEEILNEAFTRTLQVRDKVRIEDLLRLTDKEYIAHEIPKAIDQTIEGVDRVATIVSAMKEFSHPGTKEKTPLDLNHAIQNTITIARAEWKYVAELETDFDPTLPLVSCQPGELNQVILNLLVNAAHAIADVVGKDAADKGTIRIRTRNLGESVEVRIQDTGAGIPEKIRTRIFDPFFTTKEIGKGTGQGLPIARSVVVDHHGGSIDFVTEEGRGTTFIVILPIRQQNETTPTEDPSIDSGSFMEHRVG